MLFTLGFECADDTLRVIINPDGSASGWDVDAQRELTGVRCRASWIRPIMSAAADSSWLRVLSTAIDARFHLGELTEEPTDVDPAFTLARA